MGLLQNDVTLFLFCVDYTCIIFLFGFSGVIIARRNVLLMLLCLELTFLVSVLNFIFAGAFLSNIFGSIYGILVILVVAADTAIGLSLVVLGYRGSNEASFNFLITLRG